MICPNQYLNLLANIYVILISACFLLLIQFNYAHLGIHVCIHELHCRLQGFVKAISQELLVKITAHFDLPQHSECNKLKIV